MSCGFHECEGSCFVVTPCFHVQSNAYCQVTTFVYIWTSWCDGCTQSQVMAWKHNAFLGNWEVYCNTPHDKSITMMGSWKSTSNVRACGLSSVAPVKLDSKHVLFVQSQATNAASAMHYLPLMFPAVSLWLGFYVTALSSWLKTPTNFLLSYLGNCVDIRWDISHHFFCCSICSHLMLNLLAVCVDLD